MWTYSEDRLKGNKDNTFDRTYDKPNENVRKKYHIVRLCAVLDKKRYQAKRLR